MALPTDLNPRLVEALHREALELADAIRCRFAEARRAEDEALLPPGAGGLFACEALRTTTRVMHCLAWLLNHRAFFAGEISELQLRRHGRLIATLPGSDPAAERLPADARRLIDESLRLYARIVRLEQAWRGPPPPAGTPSALDRLRRRLAAVPA